MLATAEELLGTTSGQLAVLLSWPFGPNEQSVDCGNATIKVRRRPRPKTERKLSLFVVIVGEFDS